MFLNFWSISCCEKAGYLTSAGAIYLPWRSFTQSDGTLTITNASAERSGGVVWWTMELLRVEFGGVVWGCLSWLHGLFWVSPSSYLLTSLHVQVASIHIPTNPRGSLNSEVSRCYEKALHLLGRCHLRYGGKLHPVGWQLDDHRRIVRVRWRRVHIDIAWAVLALSAVLSSCPVS